MGATQGATNARWLGYFSPSFSTFMYFCNAMLATVGTKKHWPKGTQSKHNYINILLKAAPKFSRFWGVEMLSLNFGCPWIGKAIEKTSAQGIGNLLKACISSQSPQAQKGREKKGATGPGLREEDRKKKCRKTKAKEWAESPGVAGCPQEPQHHRLYEVNL